MAKSNNKTEYIILTASEAYGLMSNEGTLYLHRDRVNLYLENNKQK